jgi:hypothetical protein
MTQMTRRHTTINKTHVERCVIKFRLTEKHDDDTNDAQEKGTTAHEKETTTTMTTTMTMTTTATETLFLAIQKRYDGRTGRQK